MFRSTGVVGLMTLLSRVLGLVRDIFFARLFGTFPIMDAFFVAFKIPNSFRRFFAEGAFSRAFIPVLSDYKENQGQADIQELIDRTSGTLGAILFAISLVGIIAAPVIVLILPLVFLMIKPVIWKIATTWQWQCCDLLSLTFCLFH